MSSEEREHLGVDTTTLVPDGQGRGRDKAIRFLVWIIGVVLVLCALPGTIGLAWAPNCGSCHRVTVGQRANNASVHTGHNNLSCKECHVGRTGGQKLAFRERVMYQMVLPLGRTGFAEVGRDEAIAKNCRRCHEEKIDNEITVSNGIRIEHSDCAVEARCTDCHATVGHDLEKTYPTTYQMDDCVACHVQETVSQVQGCQTCHAGNYRNEKGAWQSTFTTIHAPNWKDTHGMGNQETCRGCHAQNFCEPCHGPSVPHDAYIVRQHGVSARQANAKCSTCHEKQRFCDNCHQIEMPHPGGFLRTHAKSVDKLGEAVCKNCHAQGDCDRCHTAHTHPGGAGL